MENVNKNDPSLVGENQNANSNEDRVDNLDSNEIGGVGPDGKPLPKIHPHLHNTVKHKMFGNHSVSDDIPKTKTGL